ncbi:hypothetical protein LPJ66_005918, partial [Kickxella alabastrina]
NLVEGYKFSTNNKVAKSLPFFASNSIYRSDLISSYQNATDFSEHLQVQPDDLLSDFVKLATASLGAKDTKWYRNMPGKAPSELAEPEFTATLKPKPKTKRVRKNPSSPASSLQKK